MHYQSRTLRFVPPMTLANVTVAHRARRLVLELLRAAIVPLQKARIGSFESKFAVLVLLLSTQIALGSASLAQQKMTTISEFAASEGLHKVDNGFLAVYTNPAQGTIFLEIPENRPDLLYQSFLTSGFGSRDLAQGSVDALDRGKSGQSGLVAFRRFGQKVLLIDRNTNYYTPSSLGSLNDAALFFPNSVLGFFDVKGVGGGNVLVDATNFFLRDGINIPAILKSAGQGSYSVDSARSVLDVSRVFATEDSVGVGCTSDICDRRPSSRS
jgi:hypothetical protein